MIKILMTFMNKFCVFTKVTDVIRFTHPAVISLMNKSRTEFKLN